MVLVGTAWAAAQTTQVGKRGKACYGVQGLGLRLRQRRRGKGARHATECRGLGCGLYNAGRERGQGRGLGCGSHNAGGE